MKKITYTNKEDIVGMPDIDNKNKVTSADMNEIKSAVNDNYEALKALKQKVDPPPSDDAKAVFDNPVKFPSGKMNEIGDNAQIGDIGVPGTIGIKGVGGDTTLKLIPAGDSDNSHGVKWSCTKDGESTISGILNGTFKGTLTGNASSADSVRTPRVAPGNFNDIPTKERTIFKEYSDSSSNIPSNHWYYGMTLQGADINYTTQLALGMTTEQLHYRTRQGGNWGQWKKLGFAPFSTTAIAYAGWWGGGAAPYTCTISIPKVTSSNIVEVGLGSSANDDQVKACMKASIAKITQANGSITLYAYGSKPTADIPLSIVVMEN